MPENSNALTPCPFKMEQALAKWYICMFLKMNFLVKC